MIGITHDELFEALGTFHEIEFKYFDQTYVIQPEQTEACCRLIIGVESTADYVIATSVYDNVIDENCINRLLNTACFNGKSFNDISDDVIIVSVY